MADFDDAVDFKSLEKELATAVARDEKYQRENDAKFRAIHQKVQSYEEFRDIVEASHLKPLDRGDKLGGMSYQKWNALSTNKPGQSETNFSNSDKLEQIKQPQTTQDFLRTWKHQCQTQQDKCLYLFSINKDMLLKCFAVECPMGEIILCIRSSDIDSNALEVLRVLDVMCKAKRFRLLLDFLSSNEQKQLDEVFQTLKSHFKSNDTEHLEKLKLLTADYNLT